ncbi:hypothetical protein PR048_024009 [Dryococelus australis]|uniref:Uncharacterized protein n=1 Tax=Dryococelus australis TaxID=614101 RepID=A0ABQ9GVN8_9NEOP|nr:hypothetical protein PR048_024009 [Dryococelus australis]
MQQCIAKPEFATCGLSIDEVCFFERWLFHCTTQQLVGRRISTCSDGNTSTTVCGERVSWHRPRTSYWTLYTSSPFTDGPGVSQLPGERAATATRRCAAESTRGFKAPAPLL